MQSTLWQLYVDGFYNHHVRSGLYNNSYNTDLICGYDNVFLGSSIDRMLFSLNVYIHL